MGTNFYLKRRLSQEQKKELKDFIEKKGGKTTGSVSAKTDYLINNDVASNSSKNKKAKELGIPILSEEDFFEILKTGKISGQLDGTGEFRLYI